MLSLGQVWKSFGVLGSLASDGVAAVFFYHMPFVLLAKSTTVQKPWNDSIRLYMSANNGFNRGCKVVPNEFRPCTVGGPTNFLSSLRRFPVGTVRYDPLVVRPPKALLPQWSNGPT